MNELARAVGRHRMWFGTYTRDGRLIKVQVWCFLHNGNIEFLTARDSLKAKRASRNPQVICFLGSEDGSAVPGSAELITDGAEIWRGYGTYWKTHPAMMLLLSLPMRKWIASGRQIMVRVYPDDPNPFHNPAPAGSEHPTESS